MRLDVPFMKDTFFLALKGIPMTLFLTGVTLALAIPLGFMLAVFQGSPKHRIWNRIFAVYVSYTRGTPVIVQMLLVYAVMPRMLNSAAVSLHLPIDVYALGNTGYAVFFFVIWMTAFLSETFRSGLASVGSGQYEAAVSNGIGGVRAYVRIIVPQVFASLLPVLCTSVNNLIKMTSLSFSMTVMEITAIAKVAAAGKLAYLEAYLVIAVMYLILCISVELIFKALEHWAGRSGRNAQTRAKKLTGGVTLAGGS